MPTYDYKCEQCGKFEYYQSIKDDALATCPTCGESVKRLISNNVNIIFKGSGFYATDNRSNSYQKAATAESGDGSSGSKESGKGSAGGSDGSSDKGKADGAGAPASAASGSTPKSESAATSD